MTAARSQLPGPATALGDLMRGADPKRRNTAIRKIGTLFAQSAPLFSPKHVALFDDVLTGLIQNSDADARADLAEQLAPLANAPPSLVTQLAADNLIAVSGPLLRHSPMIGSPMLVEIARRKGQPHLLAIAERKALTHEVTDVIVRRGDRDVVRRVAGNEGALFSDAGLSSLVRRAGEDGTLALTIGQRADVSDSHLKALLDGSIGLVRRRLIAAIPEARRDAVGLGERVQEIAIRRDYRAAQSAILALKNSDALTEDTLVDAAKRGDFETSVAALSALSGARIAVIDEVMNGERHDPVLVLARAIDLDWTTVCALIALRGVDTELSARALGAHRQNYERLMRPTAQRVLGFWRARAQALGSNAA